MSFASISSFLNSTDGRLPSSNGGWYIFDQGDLHINIVMGKEKEIRSAKTIDTPST